MQPPRRNVLARVDDEPGEFGEFLAGSEGSPAIVAGHRHEPGRHRQACFSQRTFARRFGQEPGLMAPPAREVVGIL